MNKFSPTQKHDIQRKYLLSCYIQNENMLSNATNVLSNVTMRYTMQERDIQCKNLLSNAKNVINARIMLSNARNVLCNEQQT